MPQEPAPKNRIAIVGAGLAGLSCARRLQRAGRKTLVLEASGSVGGRVHTERIDGFALDRGFQVFLSAYPTAQEILDFSALELRPFKAGALVYKGAKLRRMMDVFRSPRYLLGTALQPIGGLKDKILVAKLRSRLKHKPVAEIASAADCSTETFLREFGFSESMIDDFFRPFYGGIFLERELRTSSRMFCFTFKMFAGGSATLPAGGMQAIPEQIAAGLDSDSIRLSTPVRSVSAEGVILESGERIDASAVVVATDGSTAVGLLGSEEGGQPRWRSVTQVYYSAARSPLDEAIIALRAGPDGIVNSVCVPSDVAPDYAPPGQSLISVAMLGCHNPDDLEATVTAELRSWFGSQVDGWRHLRTEVIKRALPEQPAASPSSEAPPPFIVRDGVYVCGDHCASASIEGALVSGHRAAEAILEAVPA